MLMKTLQICQHVRNDISLKCGSTHVHSKLFSVGHNGISQGTYVQNLMEDVNLIVYLHNSPQHKVEQRTTLTATPSQFTALIRPALSPFSEEGGAPHREAQQSSRQG